MVRMFLFNFQQFDKPNRTLSGPALGILAILATTATAPAAAQEPGEPSPAEESAGVLASFQTAVSVADETFGEYLVAPLATVLFWDVTVWDNSRDAAFDRCNGLGLSDNTCRDMLAWPDDGQRLDACVATGNDRSVCKDVIAGVSLPFIVLWLVLGALFFTFRYSFINLRAFGHAIAVTRGRYDDPNDPGEVSHFQALSSALSATVGLGNIAGVAVAVGVGGPGAVFWMIVAGFLGMTSKFTECTLGQLYRKVEPGGTVSGGPMRYLSSGLAELGGGGSKTVMAWLGKGLAVMFAFMCIGGSLGGGNMFQANQSAAQLAKIVPFFADDVGKLVYGIVLAILVGVVIIGGIRRIGAVAGYIVPIMCGIYLLAGFGIIFTNLDQVGPAFGEIFGQAFSPEAGFGGFLGVLVQGFRRAAFSNEAGIGSASIAHSAAATDEPVREGIVALLEPFIDTIVVCTMTALVIVITGVYRGETEGIEMTSAAFETVFPWFPHVLTVAAFMFAFSTMISWSYYGERCWAFLFGPRSSIVYRIIFLVFVVLGSVLKLGSVIDFSDLMILGMAFPNILGLLLLSNKVGRALSDYMGRLRSGEMKPNAAAATAKK